MEAMAPWEVMLILLHLLSWHQLTVTPASAALQPKPGCQPKCGNMTIPFPFGIGDDCSREGFNLTCNHTTSPPIPYLGTTNLDLFDIQLDLGLARLNQYTAYDCYTESGYNYDYNNPYIDLISPPFMFSDARNKFVAIGCDTAGFLHDETRNFTTGCLSVCDHLGTVPNGTCSGIGCCEAPIPKGLSSFSVGLSSFDNHTKCFDFSPCSYGFLADVGWFNFSSASFGELRNVTNLPVTVEWAIGNQICEVAQKNSTEFACASEHSHCYNSTNGPGYRCSCDEGFQGNPYLVGGCMDADECAAATNPCVKKCKNTQGNYTCSCPRGMVGDGRINGSGCRSILLVLDVVLGGGAALLFAIVIGSWLYWAFKKRRLIKLKEKFFRQNGGFLLEKQISSVKGAAPAMKVYTMEELRMATENYDSSRILGQGGSGTVYKGYLPDQGQVAIKKSKITNAGEIEQFINEVVILSHVNHRNVVKLLGCCLETEVPMLVYEFVHNGTLCHHIQSEQCRASLSLDNRLRIAAETAGALAYLHSAASIPIIHRDVKSTNILLDHNYTAKVADFGASRLVPFDKNGLTSLVRGTFGYLDPEYFLTAQFTDKSDVYSFGVVLVELLTGEKPVPKGLGENKNLAMHFLSCMKGGRLFQILEDRVKDEGSQELLLAVAELAKNCLRVKGEERPTMKEVAMELEGLRRSTIHPWVKENEEKKEAFLSETDFSDTYDTFGGQDFSSSVVLSPFNIMR